MKISNRVRRNIAFVLFLVGIACTAARGWELFMSPANGRTWFNLCSIIILTYICFDRLRTLHARVKQGIRFGA